jgi:hypothetical protein
MGKTNSQCPGEPRHHPRGHEHPRKKEKKDQQKILGPLGGMAKILPEGVFPNHLIFGSMGIRQRGGRIGCCREGPNKKTF